MQCSNVQGIEGDLWQIENTDSRILCKNKDTHRIVQEIVSKYMNMKVINTKKTAKKSGRVIAFQHTSE